MVATVRASRAAVKTDKYPERPLPAEVPLEDTLAALEEYKAAGKIKHIGTWLSNDLFPRAKHRPLLVASEFNMCLKIRRTPIIDLNSSVR